MRALQVPITIIAIISILIGLYIRRYGNPLIPLRKALGTYRPPESGVALVSAQDKPSGRVNIYPDGKTQSSGWEFDIDGVIKPVGKTSGEGWKWCASEPTKPHISYLVDPKGPIATAIHPPASGAQE